MDIVEKKELLIKTAKELLDELEENGGQIFLAVRLMENKEAEMVVSCNPEFILGQMCFLSKEKGLSCARFNNLLSRTMGAYEIILKGDVE